MEYRVLGRTGVKVSQLCFGTMSFGAEADEAMSAAMFHRCRDIGINFFDTADVYGKGRSEEILGGFITDCRDDIVLTSKVNGPMGDGVNAQGLSRRHIMMAVEASLRRLKTDRLDLYFVHSFDSVTAIEHTLRAFDDLVRRARFCTRQSVTGLPGRLRKLLEFLLVRDWRVLSACSRCIIW